MAAARPSPRRGLTIPPDTLRALRARCAWTQDDAARIARVKPRQWQRWEAGDGTVNAASWALVCQAAGVPEDWSPAPASDVAPPADPE
jgi:transcriptional regulator with XRE-family HTH domain